MDLVRLGQPLHSGNPWAFGARHFARSGNRGDRPFGRQAGSDRVGRSRRGGRLLHSTRSKGLCHKRRQRDGEVLPFRLLLLVAGVGRTLGRPASRHISLFPRRCLRPGETVQRNKLRAGAGSALRIARAGRIVASGHSEPHILPSESIELLRSACWTDRCPDIRQRPVSEPAATFRPDGRSRGGVRYGHFTHCYQFTQHAAVWRALHAGPGGSKPVLNKAHPSHPSMPSAPGDGGKTRRARSASRLVPAKPKRRSEAVPATAANSAHCPHRRP
jgi:hypothetical protein